MMDCTDRHERFLLRLISRHARLYTEMVFTGALVFGDSRRFLEFHDDEHPLALQLGGSDATLLKKGAAIGAGYGYDEINLNVGCPSDRVQSGEFGVCLMKKPRRVADCIRAMQDVVDVPVTIKHRIGVDDQDSLDRLKRFVEIVAATGCRVFVIHARKAWLKGLSPKQNREIPPLNYPFVHQIKSAFPELTIVVNGGLSDLQTARQQLNHVDGVMLGRAVYSNPYLIKDVDRLFFADTSPAPSRRVVLSRYLNYCETQLAIGVPMHLLTRHIHGLFRGCHGARRWRRSLTEGVRESGYRLEFIERAADRVSDCSITS